MPLVMSFARPGQTMLFFRAAAFGSRALAQSDLFARARGRRHAVPGDGLLSRPRPCLSCLLADAADTMRRSTQSARL